MQLIILVILEAQANVLTPHDSLSPTSLSIRLLQSSQLGNDHRRHCVGKTYEECKDIGEQIPLVGCVSYTFVRCIYLTEMSSKGYFSRVLSI